MDTEKKIALIIDCDNAKTDAIYGISTISYAWRSKSSTPGAQIDLVIERADKIVNLCEIKYSQTPYSIDKEEY